MNLIKRIIPVVFLLFSLTVMLTACGAGLPDFRTDLEPIPAGSAEYHNKADALTGGPYDDSPWPGAHRDTRNSDYVPYPSPDSVVPSWFALEKENFFMGPTVDSEGNVYVTSAGGPGKSSLHSFDKFGNLRWASAPMESLEDLDYAAYVSAPVLGNDNDLYIADANQFRRYRTSDGREDWVVDLPSIGINRIGFSAFLLSDELVGYAFGDGNVGVFRRDSGSLAFPLLQLPGVNGPPSAVPPPGTLAGLMYEPFIQETWDAVFGLNMEMANTPCVHPDTGRIFIIATGRVPDETVLYGIDLKETGLEIAFETLIGNTGSGTSPTLGFDGRYVYVTDGKGRLNGVDTETGEVSWKSTETSVVGVSPSTSPEGRVYSSDFNWLKCWDGSNGDIIWKADVGKDVGEAMVKGLPSKYGKPGGDIVSGVLVTEDSIWVIVSVTSIIDIPEKKRTEVKIPIEGLDPSVYKQPLGYFLVSYDHDGNLKGMVPHPDTGALMAQGFDGRIYSTSMSVTSSIGWEAGKKMPAFMRNTPEPRGGLTVYEPESFTDFADKVENWISSLPGDADSAAAGKAMKEALPSIREQGRIRGE